MSRNAWGRAGLVLAVASLPALLVVLSSVPLLGGLARLMLPASVALPVFAAALNGVGLVHAARHHGAGGRTALLGLGISALSTVLYVGNARSAVTPDQTMQVVRARVHEGMSVREVLAVVDELQQEPHWLLSISVSGTTYALDSREYWENHDPAIHVLGPTWTGHQRRSAADLDAAARELAGVQQLWIVGRTMPGFFALSVELGADGRAVSVSSVSGSSS